MTENEKFELLFEKLEQMESGLKSEIHSMESGLKSEIHSVESELKSEIRSVDSNLRSEIEQTREDLKKRSALILTEIDRVHKILIQKTKPQKKKSADIKLLT